MDALTGEAVKRQSWDSRRLWSLWDMIDFHLGQFLMALTHLNIAQTRTARAGDPERVIDDGVKALIANNLSLIERECINLGMPSAITRISRINVISQAPCTYGEMHREINELFDAVEHDANG